MVKHKGTWQVLWGSFGSAQVTREQFRLKAEAYTRYCELLALRCAVMTNAHPGKNNPNNRRFRRKKRRKVYG